VPDHYPVRRMSNFSIRNLLCREEISWLSKNPRTTPAPPAAGPFLEMPGSTGPAGTDIPESLMVVMVAAAIPDRFLVDKNGFGGLGNVPQHHCWGPACLRPLASSDS
jgi:hypothetical protein